MPAIKLCMGISNTHTPPTPLVIPCPHWSRCRIFFAEVGILKCYSGIKGNALLWGLYGRCGLKISIICTNIEGHRTQRCRECGHNSIYNMLYVVLMVGIWFKDIHYVYIISSCILTFSTRSGHNSELYFSSWHLEVSWVGRIKQPVEQRKYPVALEGFRTADSRSQCTIL